MKLLPVHLLAATCFAAFALAGWHAAAPEKQAAPPTADAPSGKASKRGPRTAGKAAMPEDVRQRLAAIHAARTPDERLRATLALAHSLPVSEMERWYQADWFDFHDNMDSNLFYRITRARWLAEDPEELMSYFLRCNHDKTYEMAERWAQQDPHAALSFLQGVKDHNDLQRITPSIAGPLAEADPAGAAAEVLRLQKLFGDGQSHAVTELIAELARHAPDLLEAESAAWPAGIRRTAREALVIASLTKDFATGIATLRDAPDGKKRFMEALSSNRELVKEMAKLPDSLPEGWFVEAASNSPSYVVDENPAKWINTDLAAMGFNDEQSQLILEYAINYLGERDPDRALDLLEGDALDQSLRQKLLSNSMSSLVSKDKARVAAWVATLTDPEEIELARRALYNASDAAAGKAPPTPSEWLSGLADKNDPGTWPYGQHAHLTRSWDRDQLAAAVTDFAEFPTDQKTVVATKFVKVDQNYVPAPLRAEAIRHLLENPVEPAQAVSNGAGNELLRSTSNLASSWGREDPVAAGRWIRSLPPGDERLWAAKNLAAHWAEYEPSAARQWAAALPADERQEVIDYLKTGSAQRP